MDKLRIDQFKGLYTNANEASLNPEYQREAFNVRFKAGSMESEGYTRLPLNYGSNVVYVAPVRLDEDRYGSKLENNELIADYTQNYQYYLLVQIQYSEGYKIQVHQTNGQYIDIVGYVTSRIKKIVESDGIVKILLESGEMYWLGRINRFFKGDTQKTVIPFYLTKIPSFQDQLIVNVEDIPGGEITELKNGKFYFLRNELIPGPPGYLYYVYFNFKGLDNQLLDSNVQVAGSKQTGIMILSPSLTFKSKYVPTGMAWDEYLALGDLTIERFTSTIFITEENSTPPVISPHDYREVLLTIVFDDTSEYVAYLDARTFSNLENNLNIKVSLSLTENFNKRITAIGVYVRYRPNEDFEQTHYFNLTTGVSIKDYETFYITDLSPNGFFLSQTIGIVYETNTYKPIKSFSDYLEMQGVAYGTYQNRIYFCSVGKGKIMKEVFYDYIPEAEGEFLVDVNGSLGVFSGQLDLIAVQDSGEGYLLFSFKDSLNFTIRDQYDLATSPEGIIIHTNRGIYVTNGYERLLISEQINDIVEKNYDTGNIFYDDTNDVLFYLCGEGSWRYDFAYPQWAQFIIKNGEDYNHLRGILSFGYDGEMYQNVDSKVYQLQKTNDVTSIIQTPKVDLDFPNIAKIVTYFIFDFEGRLILSVQDQLDGQIKYDVTHTERRSAMIGVPVGMRIPSATLGSAFTFSGKIYAIEIHYDILGEFRDEDFIPSPEAYFQGPSQLTELLKSIRQKAKAGS